MKIRKLLGLSVFSIVTASMLYGKESFPEMNSITVTANKVEENIQDVPQSITVIDSELINQKGLKTVEDVISEIPNMTTTPDRGVKVNFRGLNASLFTENNPIVVYIDGIPTSFKRAFSASLENVERIEVLRGPQGTLYGKDSIGGVINIITKEPTNEISGSIGLEYGSNNYKRGTFNINAPFVENKLFFNINGELKSTDGWVTNTNKNDDKSARERDINIGTSLYYKATDKLSTKLVLKKVKTKNYGFKGYGIVGSTGLDKFTRNSAENTNFEMPMLEKNNINSQSINIHYEADKYILDAVTVHRKTDLDGIYDADYTSNSILDGSSLFNKASSDTYSQEIRFANKESDGIRWVGGLYFDKGEKKKDAYGTHVMFSGIDYSYSNAMSTINSSTEAIFAQSMIPINEKLELTLGARYQIIKKKIDLTSVGYALDTNTFTYINSSSNFDADERWNVFIPKVALNYKVNDQLSPFLSISKGYMPGGFNSSPSTMNEEENKFQPQQSTNYEVGIKGFLENINFTASIFRMNIKDIHTYRQVTTGSTTLYYTDNADEGHSEGIELDFNYFPTDTLEISGAFGYIKTKYDSYSLGDNDFSGKNIETTPSHTANLSIAYTHPNGFYARTDIKSQGSMYFYDDVSKTFPKENGYTLVDIKAGYKFLDWDIYTYVKNLTDEEYINMYESNPFFSMATYGDPRFIGIGLKYTF